MEKYSQEIKEQAVQECLSGMSSLDTIVENYTISNRSFLRHWIKQYTSNKEIKATSKGLSRMKQGRVKLLFKNVLRLSTSLYLMIGIIRQILKNMAFLTNKFIHR